MIKFLPMNFCSSASSRENEAQVNTLGFFFSGFNAFFLMLVTNLSSVELFERCFCH